MCAFFLCSLLQLCLPWFAPAGPGSPRVPDLYTPALPLASAHLAHINSSRRQRQSLLLLSVFTALLWSFCTVLLRTFRVFFSKGILDHGPHSCRFVSFHDKAILSSTCQSHPALVPFPFSVPQPISPCYTTTHITFLLHRSVSLLFIKGMLHTTPARKLFPH